MVNNVLLELEEHGFNEAQMNEAFRVVHTIKGTAAVIRSNRSASFHMSWKISMCLEGKMRLQSSD